jgi:hypothetical protein
MQRVLCVGVIDDDPRPAPNFCGYKMTHWMSSNSHHAADLEIGKRPATVDGGDISHLLDG